MAVSSMAWLVRVRIVRVSDAQTVHLALGAVGEIRRLCRRR
jgi:hypothetical protein